MWELELLFKMGHCAGIRNSVKERVSPSDADFATEALRTCGPSTAAAAEDAIKRGLKHLCGKHCRFMCFIGRLVAKMGSDFLFEVLMEGTELHVVVVGVESVGFVAQTKVVAVSTQAESLWSVLHCSPDATPRCYQVRSHVKDIVEDGLIDLWTDGKMTVEELVE